MEIKGQETEVDEAAAKKQDLSKSSFGKGLAALALGSSLLAGCVSLKPPTESPEVPNIPSRRYINPDGTDGDIKSLIAGHELVFSSGSVVQYTEFYGPAIPFENDIKELYDIQQSYMEENSYHGFLGNLIVDSNEINKENFLKQYGFFIEKKPIGENGLMPVNLRVVSKAIPANADIILRYDDIQLFIKNYGEQNQKIFVNLESGLEQCTALKVIEGDSVELEFEEPVNKSIRYYFNRRPDGRICKAENYTSDLLGYRRHIDDYFYNKTGGTLVRTELKIDPKTLQDDAIKLFQNISPDKTPIFSTSYHGSVNYNRGVGNIPNWIGLIAEAASKCHYQKPVVLMISNCYDGITAEVVEQMAKLPQGSIIYTSNDFRPTKSQNRYIMLNNNTTLVESLLSYSSFYLNQEPDNQNIMLAVVTADGVKVFSEENRIILDEKSAAKDIHVSELLNNEMILKGEDELRNILMKDKNHNYRDVFPYLANKQFRFVLSGSVFAAENSSMHR